MANEIKKRLTKSYLLRPGYVTRAVTGITPTLNSNCYCIPRIPSRGYLLISLQFYRILAKRLFVCRKLYGSNEIM